MAGAKCCSTQVFVKFKYLAAVNSLKKIRAPIKKPSQILIFAASFELKPRKLLWQNCGRESKELLVWLLCVAK